MKNYLKIITAGTAGIMTTKLMGYGSLTVIGFGIFMLTYLTVSLAWQLLGAKSFNKTHFNFKKVAVGVGTLLLLVMSFAYFILWQYQNTTPFTNTLLDQHRSLNKLYSELVQFNPHLSNYDYRKLRYQFTEHLIQFDLSDDEKQQIWKNYLKLFVLQTKIRNLLIDIKVDLLGDTISYGYEYSYANAKVTPFRVNSFITTFNNHEKGAVIPSHFNKKPTQKLTFKDNGNGLFRANLPYFNNAIPINKKHMAKIKLIHKMTVLSFQIIQLNKQLAIKS